MPKIVSTLAPLGRLGETNQLRLAIGLPLRDPAGLDNFVAQVSDPASPNFRHFLTREEITAKFGPTEQDYAAVKNFANANGLAITVSHANRLLLDVTGPAAAVEKAFHITLRTYRHPTEARDFFAPDTEPMVDAALPVADILGLSDYSRPHPKFVSPANKNAAKIAPKKGTAPDGSGDLFGNDFRNAYVPGVTLTGAGQSVGLLEFDGYYAKDISNYATMAGNGRTNIVVQAVLVDGYNGHPSTSSINGGEVEVELDIEMAMAIAPGLSKIVSFEGGESGNQNDILNAILADSNVVNLSCSWGWSGGPTNTTDTIFKMMDAVGQTFFNASGDNQAFTTGSNSVNGVDNPSLDNAPSSNPYITQVGATTLKMNGTGASWASEVVWNWAVEEDDPDVGSSGGISSYYPIPSWQTNVSNMAAKGGSTSFRNIPDVAANGDTVYIYYGNGKHSDDIAGTSCAAPLWAGFMALVNQQVVVNGGSSIGFVNPALYAIAAGSNYASCFHDVTSGNNTWSSSTNLFYVTNNYDLCTGLGTMNGQNMINALVSTTTTFTNLTASQSITYGTTVITLSGQISAAGPVYPTNGETVTVTIDGKTQTNTIDDSTGDFSFNYKPRDIPASGTAYTITYTYAGDASLHPAANTSTTLTVNKAALSITADPQSKTYGQTLVFGSGSTLFTDSGLQNSETIGSVTLAVSGSRAGGMSNAAVGNYTITPSAATGGTFNSANYLITYDSNSLTVNPRPVILTGTRPYDGTTNAASTNLSVSNVIGSDNVIVVSGSGGLAGANVGTNAITSVGSLALGGTTSSNYTLTGVGGTVIVTPFPIVLTGARPYDGTNDAAASILTISNDLDGANLTLSGSGTLAGAGVGIEPITVFTGLALSGIMANNYTLTGASGSVTISNSFSPFSITTATLDVTGTNFVVCWQSVPGVVYSVLTNTGLAAPASWSPAGSPVTATNTTACFTLPGGIAGNTNVFVVIMQ